MRAASAIRSGNAFEGTANQMQVIKSKEEPGLSLRVRYKWACESGLILMAESGVWIE